MTEPADDQDEAYETCTWHADRVASLRVHTVSPGGQARWVPSCEECAEEFTSKEQRPWD